jgi:hypothetical protein
MKLTSLTTPSALVGAIMALAVVGAATAALCTGNLSSGDWLATVTAATTGAAGIVGAHVGASAALSPSPTAAPAPAVTAPTAGIDAGQVPAVAPGSSPSVV